MRLTTAIWLGVFMRRESERGAFVTVAKKGAQQAGAIFVLHNLSGKLFDLYGPAPQSFFEEEKPDRLFEKVLEQVSENQTDEYLARQKNFDPDLWVIETEAGSGPISLDIAEN